MEDVKHINTEIVVSCSLFNSTWLTLSLALGWNGFWNKEASRLKVLELKANESFEMFRASHDITFPVNVASLL